jgi:hypothetical protein
MSATPRPAMALTRVYGTDRTAVAASVGGVSNVVDVLIGYPQTVVRAGFILRLR